MSKEVEVFESAFELRSLKDRIKDVQEVYKADERPWIIGFSGGKDSTATLQLIWQAIERLPKKERKKPIYVLSSDTLVETPMIVDHIDQNLAKIKKKSDEEGLPFVTQKVNPETTKTFWVNLIGRGYPAPNKTFRWCTDRMKIQPADKFIMEQVSQHGEVVIVLGVRRAESMTRAQVMALRRIKGTNLSRHSKFAQALCYTPVEDWSTDDVWTYLLQVQSPWGMSNRDLAAMYRNADGECPLVIDKTTPSCGNSRFGCWTCTVVTRDKSMEAMIDNGEDWMEPLLKFRDYLAWTQDPEVKEKVREHKRRTGQVYTKTHDPSQIARGPYKLSFCKELLKMLLETQAQVRREGPDPTLELITVPELHEIRRIWRLERGDWEDSIPQIYTEVTGETLTWAKDDIGEFGGLDLKILSEVAQEHDLPLRLVTKLIDTERKTYGMARRSSIYQNLRSVLVEDWRSEDEVLEELRLKAEQQEAAEGPEEAFE